MGRTGLARRLRLVGKVRCILQNKSTWIICYSQSYQGYSWFDFITCLNWKWSCLRLGQLAKRLTRSRYEKLGRFNFSCTDFSQSASIRKSLWRYMWRLSCNRALSKRLVLRLGQGSIIWFSNRGGFFLPKAPEHNRISSSIISSAE